MLVRSQVRPLAPNSKKSSSMSAMRPPSMPVGSRAAMARSTPWSSSVSSSIRKTVPRVWRPAGAARRAGPVPPRRRAIHQLVRLLRDRDGRSSREVHRFGAPHAPVGGCFHRIARPVACSSPAVASALSAISPSMSTASGASLRWGYRSPWPRTYDQGSAPADRIIRNGSATNWATRSASLSRPPCVPRRSSTSPSRAGPPASSASAAWDASHASGVPRIGRRR